MTVENKQTIDSTVREEQPRAGWRVKVAFVIFVASLAWPVFIPVLPLMGVSGAKVAAISGTMLVIAEIMLIAAAAIAGKQGFAYIKSRVFGFLKSYGPPKKVSRTRYNIGLVMFLTPLLFAFVSPYLGQYIPGLAEHSRAYAVTFDVLLVASLFVLGGDFWDKLRSLFVHDATLLFPSGPDAEETRRNT
jgi:hypothetical protein